MSSDKEEQKPTIPAKSSMEILSELFSTFHAEPPMIIKKEKSEDSSRKHKKSKKKHKHKDKKHKKKEKKKRKGSSSSSEDSVDLAKILIKQEKDISDKKIKIEGTELAWDAKSKNLKRERHLGEESDDSDKTEASDSTKSNKVVVKSFKLNTIFESTIKEIQNKVKRKVDEEGEISDSESSTSDKNIKGNKKHKHKSSSKKRSRSSSKDKSDKKIKTDDLRHKIKSDYKHRERSRDRSREKDRHKDRSIDKDFYKSSYHSRRSDRDRDRTRDRQRDYRSKSRERHKDPYNKEIEDYKRNRSRDTSFYRDDGFYKSRDKDDRDEKTFTRDKYVDKYRKKILP